MPFSRCRDDRPDSEDIPRLARTCRHAEARTTIGLRRLESIGFVGAHAVHGRIASRWGVFGIVRVGATP
jgi:hypothetical protein